MKYKMKRLIIIIMSAIFGMHSSNAQTMNKLQIDSFLIDHTLEFNKKQKPIFCNNIDSMSKVLEKNKINYSRCIYPFVGNVLNDSSLMGGGCNTYILHKKKRFIYYHVTKDGNGLLIIEVLEGNCYI
jgi:hypothetical protein